MNKEKKEKEEFKITPEVFIEQLKENMKTGVNNLEKLLKPNQSLYKVLNESKVENLKALEEKVKEEIKNTQKALSKIKWHQKLIDEISEEIKDKSKNELVQKVISILLRN